MSAPVISKYNHYRGDKGKYSMKHFSGRRDDAPRGTFKARLRVVIKDISIIIRFHQAAKICGWYREAPNLFRHILGISDAGDARSKSAWLVGLISSYAVPLFRVVITDEATREASLNCLDALKVILSSGGSKGVEICITNNKGNDD